MGVKLHPLKQNSAAASSKAMIRFKWGTSSDFILKIIAQFFRENNLWFVKMVTEPSVYYSCKNEKQIGTHSPLYFIRRKVNPICFLEQDYFNDSL